MADACTACEFEQCPEIYCACYANEDCANIAMCIALCSSPVYGECVQSCYTDFQDGISIAALASHCAATQCQPGGCTGFSAIPKCDLCLFEQCPSEMNECLATPACAELLVCTGKCNEAACIDKCYTDNDAGVLLIGDVDACMEAHCGSECSWTNG